ncbi:MAG: deoxyribonuclease V [Anaerolineae bacterium]|nr:deoxyribonuclease V [Anaerolineae bacterium]
MTLKPLLPEKPLHDWGLSPEDARKLQTTLSAQLTDEPLALDDISLVAGVDVSVKDNVSRAAIVVLTFPGMEIIEIERATRPTDYPYVPTLLTFREGPVLLKAFAKLQNRPDVYLFDGMGRIHPRQAGIAAHIGLWLNAPTIGVGKSHLLGNYDPPGNEKGDYSPLFYKGKQLGVVLRTRTNVKPVYISPGNRMTLASAIEIVMACTPKYRLPEPIRAAHNAAGDDDMID